jgi:hypothetical protein
MTRASFGPVIFASLVLGAGALITLVNCESSSSDAPAPTGVDSGVFDPHGDSAAPPGADASGSADAADATDAADAADTTDAADAADAAPVLDEAGCPVPTGLTVSLQDAGIPSTGLKLWLRSDIGVSTINAVADGGVVCRWDDVSGNGQSFTPAAAPPTKIANGLGAMPAVSFAASQNVTRGGVLGIGATSARTSDGTPGNYFGIDANTFMSAGSREGVYATNNSYDSDIATTTNGRSLILSISSFLPGTALPGALVFSVDGTVRTLSGAFTNESNVVEDFSSANFTSVSYGPAGFTGGLIGEVVVYDRVLTTLERTMIQQHFASRF